jgi:hypothetical protein
LTAFLLGTFDRLVLARDKRGQVELTKQWLVCFIPQAPQRIDPREHEGIVTGQGHDAGFYEWFILFTLIPFGLLPAVVWWYVAIHRDTFQVALSRDHGYPATLVYSGGNQVQMEEIATALANATHLRR